MEVTLRNGFCELTMDEMQVVDGGSVAGVVGAVAVGVIGVVAGPPAAITGTVAVAAYYTGMALIAVGGVASAFGV